MPQLTKTGPTYGLAPDARVRAVEIEAARGQMRFRGRARRRAGLFR
jgi:hypothetical protein